MRPSVRLALLLLLTTRSPAHALDIIACGQEVPSGATGTLAADLTCPPSGYGVLLGSKSTLQLNGHSITGATISVYVPGGRKIVIEGPGEIAGSQQVGVFAPNSIGRVGVTVRDGVVFHDHGISGIALGQNNRVKLVLEDVTLRDNAGGAIGDCTGLKIKGTDVTITGNGGGICGDGIKLTRATITGNGVAGIFTWTARVKLVDSTVSGNDTGGDGFDIATRRRPKLVRTTCGRSVVVPEFPGQPSPASPSWGVCAND